MTELPPLKVFVYVHSLDAFTVDPLFAEISDSLSISEWNPVVWVGRLFRLDNDVGEHWFDNWDLRTARSVAASEVGLEEDQLMIVDPDRFQDGREGPCHPPAIRNLFWRDVIASMQLSPELLFEKARHVARQQRHRADPDDPPPPDLEARIAGWRARLQNADPVIVHSPDDAG